MKRHSIDPLYYQETEYNFIEAKSLYLVIHFNYRDLTRHLIHMYAMHFDIKSQHGLQPCAYVHYTLMAKSICPISN